MAAAINAPAPNTEQGQRLPSVDRGIEQLNLDFLFAEGEEKSLPGLAITTYLEILPCVAIDGKAAIKDLEIPGFKLSDADIDLQRKPS